MISKPRKKWILVLDFKSLDKVSEVESGWGIPNIQDIIRRLRGQSPQYFEMIDKLQVTRRDVNIRHSGPRGVVLVANEPKRRGGLLPVCLGKLKY